MDARASLEFESLHRIERPTPFPCFFTINVFDGQVVEGEMVFGDVCDGLPENHS
jgi:hypothetical protein